MVADEVEAKRRLMTEAVCDFHGRSVLFSSAFLSEEERHRAEAVDSGSSDSAPVDGDGERG